MDSVFSFIIKLIVEGWFTDDTDEDEWVFSIRVFWVWCIIPDAGHLF